MLEFGEKKKTQILGKSELDEGHSSYLNDCVGYAFSIATVTSCAVTSIFVYEVKHLQV